MTADDALRAVAAWVFGLEELIVLCVSQTLTVGNHDENNLRVIPMEDGLESVIRVCECDSMATAE